GELEELVRRARGFDGFDAALPCAGRRPWSGRAQVAAEVDQRRDVERIKQNWYGAIDCILLADAAEVDLHSVGQCELRTGPNHTLPSHALQQLADGPGRGLVLRFAEPPGVSQHARSNVKCAVGKLPKG